MYNNEHRRIQELHLGGKSNAEDASVEAPQAPRGVGCGQGWERVWRLDTGRDESIHERLSGVGNHGPSHSSDIIIT